MEDTGELSLTEPGKRLDREQTGSRFLGPRGRQGAARTPTCPRVLSLRHLETEACCPQECHPLSLGDWEGGVDGGTCRVLPAAELNCSWGNYILP